MRIKYQVIKMKLPTYVKTVAIASALAAIGASYLEETFIAFLIGWVVLIPIVGCAFMIYGLREYMKDHKNKIVVSVKPNSIEEKYAELIHKEEEIRVAKGTLYRELMKEKKRS